MKVSNKILLITGSVVVAVVLALIISSRMFVVDVMASDFPEDGVVIAPSGDETTTTYDVRGFDSVVLSGAWKVEVWQKDEYRVDVTMPEKVSEYLVVEQRNNTLDLRTTKPVKLPDDTVMKVVIWMPDLSKLTSAGFSDVTVSGFSGKDLELGGNGVMTCHTQNGSFEKLVIDFEGVGSYDLVETKAVDAHIEISGVSDVRVTMDGGTLSGKIDIGSVKYRGSVSKVELKGGQVAKVGRAD